VCAVPPRQNENSSGASRDVDGKQQVPVDARPLLHAGETRQRGRSKGYLPLWRVAWYSSHCVAGGKRGQKEVLCVRDFTGLVREKTGIHSAYDGENMFLFSKGALVAKKTATISTEPTIVETLSSSSH